MKIVLLIHSLNGGGGAERVAANLANHWNERGWQVILVTVASDEHDFYPVPTNVRRVVIGLAGTSSSLLAGIRANWTRATKVRRLLKEARPDVAVAIETSASALLALSGIGLRRTVRIGSQHIHPHQITRGARTRLRLGSFGMLAAVAALTEKTADWLRSHSSASRVVVIPNAVCWPIERHDPIVAPGSIGLADRHRLLAVGRLTAQKGFDLLIEAFASVAHRFPDWELVIPGKGPLLEELRELAVSAGVVDRTIFGGEVGNIGDWYESADVFVLSSRREGFPMVLMEAMANGLPVVSFDCDTGPRDIIRHEVDGLLVPPEDTVKLAEAMARLMGDRGLRQRMAARAIEVRERFSIERVGALWDDLFRSLGVDIDA